MNDGSQFARQSIRHLPPLPMFKTMAEMKAEYDLAQIDRLHFNENPLGVSPLAQAAMQREIVNCNFYPDPNSPLLQTQLAERYGLAKEQIFLTTGGDHALNLFANAFVNEGDEVIVGAPSFQTYASSTAIMGGKLVKVPLDKDLCYDLEAILAAITAHSKLIIICNPNNPTGTIVRKQQVADFMARVPAHCLVIFDEAYAEFVEDPDYPQGVDYLRQGANVIVMRTFSKAYGLAGLRVGYALAAAQLAPWLARVIPVFPVNRLAQAAAAAVLEDADYLAAVLANNRAGREYFHAEFDALGMAHTPAQGSFFFVDLGLPAAEARETLLRQGLLITPGQQWGYPNYARISIGSAEANQRLIAALRQLKEDQNKRRKCFGNG